jgi:hypothetical protein
MGYSGLQNCKTDDQIRITVLLKPNPHRRKNSHSKKNTNANRDIGDFPKLTEYYNFITDDF